MPNNKRGVILFIVLATVIIAAVLAGVILTIISSQSRLTHHRVSRIQAYYASMAGVNYALEQLRTGTWIAGTHCTPATTPACSPQLNLSTDFKPASIKSVSIVIRQSASPGCPGNSACVSATANYTYTP